MKKYLQDKRVLIGVAIVLVLALGGFFLTQRGGSDEALVAEQQTATKIDPEEIGLKFELNEEGNAARIVIEKAHDIESIQYEISYIKEIEGEEVEEGLIGDAVPKDNRIETDYREFGTCSSGVCRYDTVVSPVNLKVHIKNKDGKLYETETSVEIPS